MTHRPDDTHPAYAFDNANPHAGSQHDSLARLLDPGTFRRLEETAITDGWECLEIGAGGGSVAVWLAERVAPTGRVLATDIQPQLISEVPGLTVARHDVTADPLPEGAFDLIHARLVLSHLPERHRVLSKLLAALKPGGVIQIDEIDTTHWPILTAATPQDAKAYRAYLLGLVGVLRAAGADPSWGPQVAAALTDAGFTGVDPQCHSEVWGPDSAGVALLLSNSRHLEPALLAHGLTEAGLKAARAAMTHPAFRAVSFTVHTVQAYRPA
ncbi:class I SAM-dependent methyltransferase [Streptosporangium sp. NPDC000396]|uniref:class I SAM-dependent methyltransferase n=1 Tax=Streptosporangium sp. NPDC000396 TaxID=3366185 RepID=UPI0036AC3D42